MTARSARSAARARRPPARRARPVALTGTPGVGKSAVARQLSRRWAVVEVADLAVRTGSGRRARGGVVVDLTRLKRALRGGRAWDGVDLVVGHLAHLLPVRGSVVLRCHPRELARRLARAGRGSQHDRRANCVSEALDLVLAEASHARRPLLEVDTTGRSVRAVAREVDLWLRRGSARRRRPVDWLADPAVTAHLLDGAG